MAQAQLWLKTLRQAVKGDYGPGWILKEQYDRFKIGRAEAGNARHGKTQFVSTDLPFARGSHRKVLNLIGEMVAKMQGPELNVGLAEAYELVMAAPKSLAQPSTGKNFAPITRPAELIRARSKPATTPNTRNIESTEPLT